MLFEGQVALSRFKELLNTLKENDKNKINEITFVARDNAHLEGFPLGVVDATVDHVRSVPPGYKLLGLYVVDSIAKNVEVPYRKLFTTVVVSIFVHSFQMIRDEATRKRLFNLRATWKDIFPFHQMHDLDLSVKKLDPAWPLILPDEMRESNPLPSVPKIAKNKVSNQPLPVASSQLSAPVVTEAVIAESRDPRRNRKRKSNPQTEQSEEQFLIDRDGNRKMESIARKQGKEEASKLPLKRNRPSMRDQDMRPVAVPSSGIPANNPNHVYTKQNQDVDMRVPNRLPGLDNQPPPPSEISRMSMDALPASRSTQNAPMYLPRVSSGENLHIGVVQSQSIPALPLPPSNLPRPPLQQQQPPAHVPAPPPYSRPYPLPPPPHRSSPDQPPYNRPPIRGPMWSVEIDGLPDMINIGIDPRMLSRVPNPKTPRQITVDGRQYPLLLDRVQPLIQVDDQVHAVRFRCESLAFVIDHQRFIIPGTGYTKIRAAGRERIAYLGGPGHEIVIDGRPHTVPFNSQYATINVERQTVAISYACDFPQDINVLPAIPPKILDWARRGLFGSPGSLHLSPLNPLIELERHPENRGDDVRNDQHYLARVSPSDALSVTKNGSGSAASMVSATNASTTAASAPFDYQQLFQKLIAAGIVNQPETLPKLDQYDWEKFRKPYTKEIDALYSGFQCDQCGIRFENEKSREFDDHLDYHYVKNSAEQQEHRNRAFYQSSDYWLLSEMTVEGAPQFSAPVGVEEKEEVKCPSFADESKNVCAVCFEKFCTFFDREEGEWMLRGAVIQGDKVYHPICMEDAGKQFTTEPQFVSAAANSEPQAEEQEEANASNEDSQKRHQSPQPELEEYAVPKPEPQIESDNALVEQPVVGCSSSSSSSSSMPRVASLPSNLASITPSSYVVKPKEALPSTPPPQSPKLRLPLSVKTEPEEEMDEQLGGVVGSESACAIPGLSPTVGDICGGTQEGEVEEGSVAPSGNDGGGGSVDITPSTDLIASNPLEALQAVLRGETLILMQPRRPSPV